MTVGTTPFSRLVRFFDRPSSHEIVIQTAEPYEGSYAACFAFSSSIAERYAWAEIVVTHAGAGSVFTLLESAKRLVVVPNVDRADAHQLDLAAYIRDGHLAMVVPNVDLYGSPDELIRDASSYVPRPYSPTRFGAADWLLDLLR